LDTVAVDPNDRPNGKATHYFDLATVEAVSGDENKPRDPNGDRVVLFVFETRADAEACADRISDAFLASRTIYDGMEPIPKRPAALAA
jgi:hypothetical protein